jgi:hypothetical protein
VAYPRAVVSGSHQAVRDELCKSALIPMAYGLDFTVLGSWTSTSRTW